MQVKRAASAQGREGAFRWFSLTGFLTLAALSSTLFPSVSAQNMDNGTGKVPPPAAFAGYHRLAFQDNFQSASSIDIKATSQPGYKWYATQWFGGGVTPQQNINIDDSGLTLGGSAINSPASIESAIATKQAPYYVGTVFGGGAYFEARMAFDPTQGANANGWPAFWGLAIDHVYDQIHQQDEQWPGQAAGYAHFSELDFMEACCGHQSYVGQTEYFTTIHDWYGLYLPNYGWDYNIQNGLNFFKVGQVDWSQFHTYGCLWMPAKDGQPGYVQWFFDNQPGWIEYFKGPIGNPPLPGQSQPPYHANSFDAYAPGLAGPTFAILDQQHLALALDTDPSWPLRVAWVNVWQADQNDGSDGGPNGGTNQ